MVAGLIILLMPIVLGGWIIALLGIVVVGAGLFEFVETLRSRGRSGTIYSYLGGVVTTLLGIVLFVSPRLVLSGLLIAVILFLLFDGATKTFTAYKKKGPERWWHVFNGLFTLFLAFLVWFFVRAHLGLIAFGLVLGLRLLVEGWTMFFVPEKGLEAGKTQVDTTQHPDTRLLLEPSELIKEMQESILVTSDVKAGQDIVWCVTLLAILFAIHVLRTDAHWNFIGFISPFHHKEAKIEIDEFVIK